MMECFSTASFSTWKLAWKGEEKEEEEEEQVSF